MLSNVIIITTIFYLMFTHPAGPLFAYLSILYSVVAINHDAQDDVFGDVMHICILYSLLQLFV